MKKQIAQTLLLAATLMGTACQKNNLNLPDNGAEQQLQINVGLQKTKAPIIGKWFENTSQIQVILQDKETTTSSYGVAQAYQLDRQDPDAPGAWAAVTTPGLIVKRDVATVKAYYPADAVISSDFKRLELNNVELLDLGERNNSDKYMSFHMAFNKNVPTEMSEVFAAKAEVDYMVGTGNDVSVAEGKTMQTSIVMKHIQSMLIFRLTKDPTYTGAEELTAIEIRNDPENTDPDAQRIKKGYVDMVTLAYDYFYDPVQPMTNKRTMSKFPVGTYFAMLINETYGTPSGGEIELVLTIGGVNYTFKLGVVSWPGGYATLYNIKLSPSGVVLDPQVTVLDWPNTLKHTIEIH